MGEEIKDNDDAEAVGEGRGGDGSDALIARSIQLDSRIPPSEKGLSVLASIRDCFLAYVCSDAINGECTSACVRCANTLGGWRRSVVSVAKTVNVLSNTQCATQLECFPSPSCCSTATRTPRASQSAQTQGTLSTRPQTRLKMTSFLLHFQCPPSIWVRGNEMGKTARYFSRHPVHDCLLQRGREPAVRRHRRRC